jgi:hypothetical protein
MSELDQDWIQRDLDGGAVWDDSDLPVDVIVDLRRGYDESVVIEGGDYFEDDEPI